VCEGSWFPVCLSLQIAAIALLVVAPLGIFLAWLQATKRYRLRSVVDALIMLPLVLPPSVVGFFLVVTLGRRGIVGQWLDETLGVRIIFTPAGAVLAATIVALPLLVKTAQPSIEAVPRELHDVGRSLGLGPWALFFRVTLRWAWRGVATGLVLAFVRAMGEFGATLMFAGNIPGQTNTMPLEIFAAYQAGEDDRAFLYVAVLTIISSVTVLIAARLSPQGDRR
jgi:molybdate transport system permease protein